MLTLDLYIFVENGRAEFIKDLTTGSPAQLGPFTDRDTLTINARRVTRSAGLARNTFVEVPWDSDSMRASIGFLQAAPNSGTFKLRVDGNDSVDIDFPEIADGETELSAAQIAAFKAAALAALNGIAGVGAGAAVASDPADTPATLLYFTWTNPADDRVIEVVDNALAPIVVPRVAVQRPAPGFQQVIRLVQAPIKMTTDFALASAWSPVFVEKAAGAAGTNAIQRLTVPETAQGTLVIKTSGASSRGMAVPGLTAAQIEAALNAIVVDGDTNPTFRVSLAGGTRSTFDVEFIGPQAETAQDLLTAEFFSAVAATVATATLDLTDPRFVAALNGAESVTLKFEFAWLGGGGEEATITRDVVFRADLTQGSDVAELDELGAILTITETQIVDDTTLAPIATVAAGVAAAPLAALAAGTALSITHSLGTWQPQVRITRHIVNHTTFAADPADVDAATEETIPLGDGEYTWTAVTENTVEIVFATALVEDTAEAWDYRLLKIHIFSPDATVELIEHAHVIADVTGLQAALDALSAALGMVDGSLRVQVSNLVGKLSSSQIDMNSFVTELFALIQSDSTLNSTFTSLLSTSLVNNTTFLAELAGAVADNDDWKTALQTLILDVLASLLDEGVSSDVSKIPDVSFEHPRHHELPGPVIKTPVSTTTTDTTATGIERTYTATSDVETSGKILDYGNLSPALGDLTAGTALTGTMVLDEDSTVTIGAFTVDAGTDLLTFASDHGLLAGDRVRVSSTTTLPAGMAADTDYYVIASGLTNDDLKLSTTAGGSTIDITDAGTGTHSLVHYIADAGRKFEVAAGASITLAAVEGLDTVDVPVGAFVAFSNGHWYIVELAASTLYPTAFKKTFFAISQTDEQLIENTTWNATFAPKYRLDSLDSDLFARGRFILETAPFNPLTGSPTLDALTWTERASFVATIDAAPKQLRGSFQIAHRLTALDTFTAATSDLITVASAHGLAAGDRVKFTTSGTLPAGLALDTIYYVIASGLTSTALKVSATAGGSAVDITDTGTGTHTISHDTYEATARLGNVEAEWTPVGLDLFVRFRFDRFDPATPDSGTDLAGALVLTMTAASHSLTSLA